MKVLPWERLGIDVKIKELSEDECRDILNGRQYRTPFDYKYYVASKSLVEFQKIVKHVRLYSGAYGIKQEDLLDEVYALCIKINPLLTITMRKACDAECGEEVEILSKKLFVDITNDELLSLYDRVTSKVVGQDVAIRKIVKAVQRASAGLKDPKRPIGSFLLTGPTGVGKTYFAKILAAELTDCEEALIRIDCSEYQSRHEYSKLIGSPPGYVGHEQGGYLTGTIAKYPFAVVLFDEIEKAHEKVYNILLQIMDEGMLTDSKGKHFAFKDAVILMTSNLGVAEAEKISKTMGFGDGNVLTDDKRVEAMERALAKTFRPEFLNRINEVAHFMPLDKETCKVIVKLELDKMLSHLKDNRQITVKYDKDVINFIHEDGFSPVFGARPLYRCIQKEFADPLASMILVGQVSNGVELQAYVEDGEIRFKE